MELTASMENTDKSLIDAHCQGDPTAFGELVRRYGDRVLGYLIRMSENREQAEDLFQETFKRVHEKAHTFRGPQFKSWLFKIATNAALDGRRRRQASKAEQREQVRQAIELLPARQRATLVLTYYQQLSYPDVAEVLGCSVGTVKTQMFRALRTLADKLPDI